MIAVLRSLPQGIFWYPAVAIMVVLTLRSVLTLRPPASDRPPRVASRGSRYSRYRSMIDRAISGDRRGRRDANGRARDALEFERVCVGLLLLAGGYDGYSRAACRDYIASSAGSELTEALAEHLRGVPDPRVAADSGLPERCERVLRAVENQRS